MSHALLRGSVIALNWFFFPSFFLPHILSSNFLFSPPPSISIWSFYQLPRTRIVVVIRTRQIVPIIIVLLSSTRSRNTRKHLNFRGTRTIRLSNARPSNHFGTSIVLNHSSVFYASCFLACDSRADRSIYLVNGIAFFCVSLFMPASFIGSTIFAFSMLYKIYVFT